MGRYLLVARLASDGVTAVYRAQHVSTGQHATIKMFPRGLSGNAALLRRFFRAAESLAAVKHPHLAEVYDVGIADGGCPYIAMQPLAAGESLAGWLRHAGPLPLTTILAIGRQIAAALEAAHTVGAVHGALSPSSVFLITSEPQRHHALLLDLGVARVVEDLWAHTDSADALRAAFYTSPERCRGSLLLDRRADLYSLGCVLFEMAAGRPPFTAADVGHLSAMHIMLPAPRLRAVAPRAGDGLGDLLVRLLAKDPDDRPASAADVVETLERLDPERRATTVHAVELRYDCDDNLHPSSCDGADPGATDASDASAPPDTSVATQAASPVTWWLVSLVFLTLLGVAVLALSADCGGL